MLKKLDHYVIQIIVGVVLTYFLRIPWLYATVFIVMWVFTGIISDYLDSRNPERKLIHKILIDALIIIGIGTALRLIIKVIQ